MNKNSIKLRKPNSIPLFGRILCVEVNNSLRTDSGILLPTTKPDIICVAVSNEQESKLVVGSKIIPFMPPTYDGGKIDIRFQQIVESDNKGHHGYIVIYESELAAFMHPKDLGYDIELVDSFDYVPVEIKEPKYTPDFSGKKSLILPDHLKKS